MEIQLQELIDQIKKDGVASAEAEAAAILKAARDEADVILSKARAAVSYTHLDVYKRQLKRRI